VLPIADPDDLSRDLRRLSPRAALALIGKFPAEEVSANLHRLKEVMETGRVTDGSYSVAGKFAQRLNQHE
jgi:hypothetical protein